MNDRDIIDDIDALVDEQLAQGPVDDYTVDRYEQCTKCERTWHGLPLTLQVAVMHSFGYYDEQYDAAKDNSPIVCPGSDVAEPLPEFTPDMQKLARRYAIIMLQKLGRIPADLHPDSIEALAMPWRMLSEPEYSVREWFAPPPEQPRGHEIDFLVMDEAGVMLGYRELHIVTGEGLDQVPADVWRMALRGITPHIGARILATRSDGHTYTARISSIVGNAVTLESVPTPTEADQETAEYRGVYVPTAGAPERR